ncbi:MAG: hypothetical protein R6W71_03730 [Bacteroidales bacterium]|jgi:hypothetical protein
MENYQPCQGLTWYYRQSEGLLKLKSTIIVQYNPMDARRITATASSLVRNIQGIIDLTVHIDGTNDPNPVNIINYWEVKDIGKDKTQSEVLNEIGARSDFPVISVTIEHSGLKDEQSGTISGNSALDYA